VSPLLPWSAARRTFAGAQQAVIPAFGAGAIAGILTGLPVMTCAAAGALLGLALCATFALVRPR
jgi:hypothetical protein